MSRHEDLFARNGESRPTRRNRVSGTAARISTNGRRETNGYTRIIPAPRAGVYPASPLAVARALSAMLAGAMLDLARDHEAAGVEIGERVGTLVLASSALQGEIWRLPFPTVGGQRQ